LRREVESLLAQSEEGEGFLEAPALEVEAKHLARERSSPLDRPTLDSAAALLDPTVTSLAPGALLGPYKIEEPLGAGGMGEVYRATDTRLGRQVAVKIGREQFNARFEREAKAISSLNHPNICTLYDVGPNYLVMELLVGETLRGRLKRSTLDWRGAAEIAAAVAEGLAAAHFQMIVHRDLKPENIFLTQPADGSPGRTVILDFGLARRTPSDAGKKDTMSMITEAGMMMGTVGYMSPEQVRGEAAGAASDIFSLGCVLYEMLAGRPPFPRPTTVEVLSAILRDESAPLPGVLPSDLIQLVARCLEKTPGRRCQSARELALSFRSMLSVTSLSLATAAPAQESLIDSLAVLPFQNASGNPDTDFSSATGSAKVSSTRSPVGRV